MSGERILAVARSGKGNLASRYCVAVAALGGLFVLFAGCGSSDREIASESVPSVAVDRSESAAESWSDAEPSAITDSDSARFSANDSGQEFFPELTQSEGGSGNDPREETFLPLDSDLFPESFRLESSVQEFAAPRTSRSVPDRDSPKPTAFDASNNDLSRNAIPSLDTSDWEQPGVPSDGMFSAMPPAPRMRPRMADPNSARLRTSAGFDDPAEGNREESLSANSLGSAPDGEQLNAPARRREGAAAVEPLTETASAAKLDWRGNDLVRKVDVFFATDRLPTKEILPTMWRTFLPAMAVACICLAMLIGLTTARRLQVFWILGAAFATCLGIMVLHVSIVRWQEYSRLANNESTRFSVLRFEPDGNEYPLHVGLAEVTLPPDHQPGKLESPSLLKLEFSESPEKHIMLQSVVVEELAENWFHKISEQVRYADERECFVFIHGYNVRFADALKRTAQLSVDLQIQGPVVSYSWPSRGQVTAYAADEATVSWSAPNFQKLLVDLHALTEIRKINIVAHSMGNRALLQSIERIHLQTAGQTADPSPSKIVGTIILAAPDVDAQEFKSRYIHAIQNVADRATIYFTDNDRALQLSEKLHAAPRLGLGKLPPGFGIEAVHTGDQGLFSLGHSYYGSDPVVIDDMKRVLKEHLTADQRGYLRHAQTSEGASYWEIDRSLHANLGPQPPR